LGKSKKRTKFDYNPDDYKDDVDRESIVEPIKEPPTTVKQSKTIMCPQGHLLSAMHWSTARKVYYCVECSKDYSADDVIKCRAA